MIERFYRVEEYAKRFNIRKLLDAESAYRSITEQELKTPPHTEETEYVLESIQNESLGETTMALDIGCGSGVLTIGLLKKGIRAISVDFTLRSLKFTDQLAKRQGYSTDRVLCDAQYLPFKDSGFDVIIALSVIEHLLDDMMGFKEAVRALKHGGKVIFSFPSLHSPVFCLYSFFFNPIILLERLISWKSLFVLPKRSKFVYLGELFLTRDKVFFDDVSIHRQYDQKTVRSILRDLGLSVNLIGSLYARGRRLSLGRLQNLVKRHPYFANVFIVFGIKQ
jgi:ubiquinone/menaquinone biosynthesis C-methylase UbiE